MIIKTTEAIPGADCTELDGGLFECTVQEQSQIGEGLSQTAIGIKYISFFNALILVLSLLMFFLIGGIILIQRFVFQKKELSRIFRIFKYTIVIMAITFCIWSLGFLGAILGPWIYTLG